MAKHRVRKLAVLLVLLMGYGISVGCILTIAPRPLRVDSPLADAWQEKIDGIREIQPDDVPNHLIKGDRNKHEGDFDPNAYFSVLTNLSMEPGNVLDYVYRGDTLGGSPVLYARPETQAPYETFGEFVNARDTESQPTYTAQSGAFDYLNHVVIEDTPEGYLEFVALMYMGDQFYLVWHANYNDEQIVANWEAAETVLSAAGKQFNGVDETLEKVAQRARRLDFTPVVEMGDDEVMINFTTFTKWGGFLKYTLTVKRTFPHEILDNEVETLIEYDCGIMF